MTNKNVFFSALKCRRYMLKSTGRSILPTLTDLFCSIVLIRRITTTMTGRNGLTCITGEMLASRIVSECLNENRWQLSCHICAYFYNVEQIWFFKTDYYMYLFTLLTQMSHPPRHFWWPFWKKCEEYYIMYIEQFLGMSLLNLELL